MKKTPAGGTTLGSRTHAYRTGAGGLGAGTRPGSLLSLSPPIFQGCIKQLTLKSTVNKWNNFSTGLVVAGEARSAPDHGAKKPPSLTSIPELAAAICEIVLRALSTSLPAISGNCVAFATIDVDLSLAVARAIFEFP